MEAVHRLLTNQLHVQHLRAVIGFSMGAQQAFQWAVSYPDYMDGIVATSGTAKTYGHGIVRLEGQIAALTADPTFNGGDYQAQPAKGIHAAGGDVDDPPPTTRDHVPDRAPDRVGGAGQVYRQDAARPPAIPRRCPP